MLYHVVRDENVVKAILLTGGGESVLIKLLITLVQAMVVPGVRHLFGAVVDLLQLFTVKCFIHYACFYLFFFIFLIN